jgi:hypothetical protein
VRLLARLRHERPGYDTTGRNIPCAPVPCDLVHSVASDACVEFFIGFALVDYQINESITDDGAINVLTNAP